MSGHQALIIPAVAFILSAIAGEWWWMHRQGRTRSVAVMIGNGWMALFEQAVGLVVYAGLVASYGAIATVAPVPWSETSPWTWLAAFVLVDLAFYAYHRFSHATPLGWSLHAVHHQSPQLDFTAAVRNSPFGGTLQFVFHIPLALMGIPLLPWLIAKSINPVWQLVLHTEAVGRVGWAEGWLNTPSAHRVHHGTQDAYRDRNLGGVFVVWDRLFGTYAEETVRPAYGTQPPLASLDPIAAQLQPIRALARAVRRRGPRALLVGGPALENPQPPVRPVDSRSALLAAGGLFLLGVAGLVAAAAGQLPLWIAVPTLIVGGSASARVLR